jgi:3-polyprenyl-4-hydroxybenzoate decarboxylase
MIILQDAPSSFHVSVATGSYVIYEHITSPSSMEELRNATNALEEELLAMAT